MPMEKFSDRAEQYYVITYDFLSSLVFQNAKGVPLEIEKWTGIIQAIADLSGYSVALRLELVETVHGPKTEEYNSVGQQDVLSASPSCFVVTDKSIHSKHPGEQATGTPSFVEGC
jgi:hypothetical protein